MKKLNLYIIMLLSVCLTACTEDFNKDVAPPQSYPQEEPQTIAGFTIAYDADFASPINISDLGEEAVLKAVKATATPEVAEGATVTYRLEVSADENFAQKVELPSESSENIAIVSAAELDELVKNLFGKAPYERTLYVRSFIYILDGTSAVMIPEPVTLGTVKVTPTAPVIEAAYYLIGGINNWEFENLDDYQFEHSGLDVYEDPVFTITVEVPADGLEFKIAPQSSKDSKTFDNVLGDPVKDNTESSGDLVTEDGNNIIIADAGSYVISINMLESTYTVSPAGPTMYIIGSHVGWQWKNVNQSMVHIHSTDADFWSVQYFDAGAEIKFCPVKEWSGDFGYGAANLSAETIAYAQLTENGGNIKIGRAGWYIITVKTGADDSHTVEFLSPDVYLTGDPSGGWDNFNDATRFTVPADGSGEFISPAFVANGELRMCVKLKDTDWWKTEFVILNGKIVYRGNGGDQHRVNVTAGQKAYLDFLNKAGRVE